MKVQPPYEEIPFFSHPILCPPTALTAGLLSSCFLSSGPQRSPRSHGLQGLQDRNHERRECRNREPPIVANQTGPEPQQLCVIYSGQSRLLKKLKCRCRTEGLHSSLCALGWPTLTWSIFCLFLCVFFLQLPTLVRQELQFEETSLMAFGWRHAATKYNSKTKAFVSAASMLFVLAGYGGSLFEPWVNGVWGEARQK